MSQLARLPARLVLSLGLGASAALVGASFLDLGDPGAAALGRQEAEAQAIASLAHARWRDRLIGRQLLAPSIEDLRVEDQPGLALPDPIAGGTPEDDLDRLRIEAAVASATGGDLVDARRQLSLVIDRRAAASGDAFLTLCRVEAGAEDPNAAIRAAEAFIAHAASVPWTAVSGETSSRLLALLSVAGDLSADVRRTEASALCEALGNRAVALPRPADEIATSATGWRMVADPWWTALQLRAAESLGPTLDWSDAFRVLERRAKAFAGLAERATDGPTAAWILAEVAPKTWLAARRDGSATHLALHAASDLDAALKGDATRPSIQSSSTLSPGLVVAAFSDPGSPTVVDGGSLAGTTVPLVIVHPDPDAVARRERRRLRLIRGGLLALAALIALATAAAARMMAKARELHRLRATFVASVSHDLRTPLASIGLMAENLGSGYAKGREDVYVTSIQRETGRLRRLVDDLLDFGRLERGLLPRITRATVDLRDWLDAVAARERARCASAGAALTLEIEGEPGRAPIDAPALERAVANLVDNALKHGEAKSIRLRARRESAAVLAIEVEDAGRGLDAARGGGGSVHEHLFQPFERRGEGEGTGLGLTIVRAIAEAHGGTATLRPGPGGRGALARLEIADCASGDPLEPHEPREPAA